MQIVLYLVLLKNSLEWGKLNLRSNILKKDYCESLRIWIIIAVTGHRCKPWPCTFEASNGSKTKVKTGLTV